MLVFSGHVECRRECSSSLRIYGRVFRVLSEKWVGLTVERHQPLKRPYAVFSGSFGRLLRGEPRPSVRVLRGQFIKGYGLAWIIYHRGFCISDHLLASGSVGLLLLFVMRTLIHVQGSSKVDCINIHQVHTAHDHNKSDGSHMSHRFHKSTTSHPLDTTTYAPSERGRPHTMDNPWMIPSNRPLYSQ